MGVLVFMQRKLDMIENLDNVDLDQQFIMEILKVSEWLYIVWSSEYLF